MFNHLIAILKIAMRHLQAIYCILLKKKNVIIDKNFSIIVNMGPGRYSSIRTSISVAKGIVLSKQTKLFGYKDTLMQDFNLENIQFLINKNLIENKLIKPVYEIN